MSTTFFVKLLIFLFFCFSLISNINANNLDDKIKFFISKKEFKKKNYIVADYLFNCCIENNVPSNKYYKKSKIYSILILNKFNKNKVAKVLGNSLVFSKSILEEKYLNYAFYLNAYLIYNSFKENISNKLFYFRYKHDQKYSKKSLDLLENVKNLNKHNLSFDKNRQIVLNVINKNNIHIINYYFERKVFLAVVKRIRKFNYISKDFYDVYKNYFLIKAYNELYLSNMSKQILNI